MLVKIHDVILVDNKNSILGYEDKHITHVLGILHRAVSVMIFNKHNELMLQQRAINKYHSSLCWSNTSCSHPTRYETVLESAHRCLYNEMGFDCYLREIINFSYILTLDNGMIENEYDHLFIGFYNKDPKINHTEVINWKWSNLLFIQNHMYLNYSKWFKYIVYKYLPIIQSYL
jgi:isopentenyl-diphosphate delta-isomerase